MAGYIVPSGANFTPFSYDELVKPIQQFTEAQNAAAENYDKLAMDTEALRNYIDETNDPQAMQMYNNYVQKLQTLQDNLWSRGYNAGTIRDLSAARAGYASDITRIAKAIEDRQTRSKEYWDAVHKNPDLIMGYDPALGSLDKYIGDSNYGQDWFSYSGSTLENEVATEARNRAQDLYERMIGEAGLNSYQSVTDDIGFTNTDVDSGISLAERLLKGGEVTEEDSAKSQLVAQSIIRGIQATGANSGANGNISPEQFRKLFERASRGATSGILDFNTKYLKNATAGKGSGSGSDSGLDGKPTELGYDVNAPMVQYTDPAALKASEEYNKTFVKPFTDASGNPTSIQVRTVNGTLENVTSTQQMTDLMTESDYSRKLRTMFEGSPIDINALLEDNDFEQKFILDNREMTVRKMTRGDAAKLGLDRKGSSLGVYYKDNKGKDVLVAELSRDINNNYVYPHLGYVEKMKELNKDNNKELIESATVSSKEKSKLYKEQGFDSNLPFSEVQYAMTAKNTISHKSPSVLVGSGTVMEELAEAFTDDINTTLTSSNARSMTKGKKKDSEVGEFMLYPVGPGGKGFSKEGVNGLDILNSKESKSGKKNSFTAYPEDIAEGKMRVIVPGKGEYGFDPMAIGTAVYNPLFGNGFQDRMKHAMQIFNEPDKVLLMSDKDERAVSDWIYSIFKEDAVQDPATGRTYYPYLKYAPLYTGANGRPGLYSAKQFIHNPDLMAKLYAGFREVINEKFHNSRTIKAYYDQHKSGNTSKEPLSYNSSIID